ncbi:MAG: hypothetical protein HY721_11655, partial [Planctomycetes bacterium]|nr:hypothetical protein [Planctomycetota bacterium]
PPEAERDLEALYARVDHEVEALGVACWVRGDCCDFDRCEHRLYASTVELAHVRAKHPEAFEPEGGLCPFWVEGRCTERERRPLGCRTYFCDARYREQLEALHERCLREVRAIAARHGIPWAYAPFVAALRAGRGAEGAP